MDDKKKFAASIANKATTHFDRAIAFLWFHRQKGDATDRTAEELAADLHEVDFPKPRASRLHQQLSASRLTTKGARPKSFKISLTKVAELDAQFGDFASIAPMPASSGVLPADKISGTRTYLEEIARQINLTYETKCFDACAVMMRRMMETLLLEIFVANGHEADVKNSDGNFLPLDQIISQAFSGRRFHWNRNSKKDVDAIKRLGDVAAHDRHYVTHQTDVDDLKQRYRRLISELLVLAKITK